MGRGASVVRAGGVLRGFCWFVFSSSWRFFVWFLSEGEGGQRNETFHPCRYPAGVKNCTSRIERKMNLGSRGLCDFCLIFWEIGEFARVVENEKLMH